MLYYPHTSFIKLTCPNIIPKVLSLSLSPKLRLKSGFTLLEILLVVGIIAILAGIVIVAINPSKQLATARNLQRTIALREINKAMQQYYIDNFYYPTSTPTTTLTEICDTGSNPYPASGVTCTNLVNLSALVPNYLPAIPVDPSGASSTLSFIPKAYAATGGTGYKVMKSTTNQTVLTAPLAELSQFIAIGTTSSSGVAAMPSGLIAHYLMNDNLGTTNVLDNKGGYNGTAQQNTSVISTSSGKIGGALGFNGTSDWIGISNAPSVTNYTIAAWFNFNSYDSAPILWRLNVYNSDATGGHMFGVGHWGRTGKWTFASYGGPDGNGPDDTIALQTWYHTAITYNGSQMVLYVNGAPAYTYTPSYSFRTAEHTFKIGVNSDLRYNYFDGKVDDVRIYNRALTAGEVAQIYNSGNGTEGE